MGKITEEEYQDIFSSQIVRSGKMIKELDGVLDLERGEHFLLKQKDWNRKSHPSGILSNRIRRSANNNYKGLRFSTNKLRDNMGYIITRIA